MTRYTLQGGGSSKKMTPGMVFFFKRIFPLIFGAVGGLLLFFGLRNVERARESTAWPNTPGKVTESTVVRSHSSGKHGSSDTYSAKVTYTFTVNTQTFTGDCVAFGDYGSSDSSHAEGIVSRYPKGASETVYYNPVKPALCVLEPGLKGQAWFMPGVGLFFFVPGLLMAIFLPRAIAKQLATGVGKSDLGVN